LLREFKPKDIISLDARKLTKKIVNEIALERDSLANGLSYGCRHSIEIEGLWRGYPPKDPSILDQ